MRKKRKKLAVFGVFGFIFLLGLFVLNFVIAAEQGVVSFTILGDLEINITRPLEGEIFNFDPGEDYTVPLNVTFLDEEPVAWWFTLVDSTPGHDDIVYFEQSFVPNSSFDAVRWDNSLTVFARDAADNVAMDHVSFYVNVSNSSPIIYGIPDEIYACEGERYSLGFNVSDLDRQTVILQLDGGFYGGNYVFYVNPVQFIGLEGNATSRLFSGRNLTKDDAGGINGRFRSYNLNVSATDGEYSDFSESVLTVLEKNNAPNLTNIGTTTIWNKGENSTFYYGAQVYDIEDGSPEDGNLNFSVIITDGSEIVDLFDIDERLGIMNFTANESTSLGIYTIRVCVTDRGLENPALELGTYCGQNGGPITVCNDFSLTVTNDNRPPVIVDWYPEEFNFSVGGEVGMYFNISDYDPDGTVPDTFWFVDESLILFQEGNSFDEFRYSFPCGVGGDHYIKAVSTDGELEDFVEWRVSVNRKDCPVKTRGGGGGGGGGGPSCTSEWVCGFFGVCQNTQASLEAGILTADSYRKVIQGCEEQNLGEELCGFQVRTCNDLKQCGSLFNKPDEIQSCYYSENPSCDDGIKNCHDLSCEVLVDCGGPCSACATCTDGIKNQGEGGVDCGGPCPWKCKVEKPFLKRVEVIYVFVGVVIALLILLIIRVVRVIRMRKLANQNI